MIETKKIVCKNCGKEDVRHPQAKYCMECIESNKIDKTLRQKILELVDGDMCFEKNCALKWNIRNLLHAKKEDWEKR